MNCTIFYSWQSDLPGNVNRYFILDALKRAVSILRKDEGIKVEPRVDHDTSGVAGSPDIVATILSKIDNSQIFVCDVSVINPDSVDRKTPNPNVLVELGYAISKLGLSRIIMVMNTNYGNPEDLPFDLKTKRQTVYQLAPDQEKSSSRDRLVKNLTEALRIMLSEIEIVDLLPVITSTIHTKIVDTIKGNAPNKIAATRQYLVQFLSELTTYAPQYDESSNREEILIEALQNTIPLVTEFTKIVQVATEYKAYDILGVIYKGFEIIMEKYDFPVGASGAFRDTDFDFFKFLGYELFVTLFSFLIQEENWAEVADLLDNNLIVRTQQKPSGEELPYGYLSRHVQLLEDYNERTRSNRITYQGFLINERHSNGELGEILPIASFTETDYFLYFRSCLIYNREFYQWAPMSSVYMKQPPRYLINAFRIKHAEHLCRALNTSSVQELRNKIFEHIDMLRRPFRSLFSDSPMTHFEWQKIGTQ